MTRIQEINIINFYFIILITVMTVAFIVFLVVIAKTVKDKLKEIQKEIRKTNSEMLDQINTRLVILSSNLAEKTYNLHEKLKELNLYVLTNLDKVNEYDSKNDYEEENRYGNDEHREKGNH